MDDVPTSPLASEPPTSSLDIGAVTIAAVIVIIVAVATIALIIKRRSK